MFVLASPADTLPDPMAEGWASETFAENAGKALNQLGDRLKKGDLTAYATTPSDVLRPAALTKVYNGPDFSVQRGVIVSGKIPRPTLQTALEAVRAGFAKSGPTRLKFKVFGIAEKTTRQYVSIFGPVEGGLREINATWETRWEGGATAPVLADVRMEAYEEVLHPAPQPLFTDATGAVLPTAADVRQQYLTGTDAWRERIETFNRMFKFAYCGLAIGDADGDGLDDLFSCQNGGLPNRLFLQNADGTLRDATASSGLGLLDATQGALFLDLDNDGDQDLVTTMPSGLVFFENLGGARFQPRVKSRVAEAGYSLAAADYDGNGYVDIYVCRYHADKKDGAQLAVPVPYFNAQNGGANYLVRNLGPSKNGGWLDFDDATQETGLDTNNRRFSFAAVWDDLDGDGDPDLTVANDFGRKVCYLNDLMPSGKTRFREVAETMGLVDGGFGMSVATGDFDRDGKRDLYFGNMFSAAGSRITRQPKFRPGASEAVVTEFQHMARGNTLYLGRGDAEKPTFSDVSEPSGTAMGRWSWGAVPADINHDGWEDLLVANGYVTGRDPGDL
jgi:hypothetical protein